MTDQLIDTAIEFFLPCEVKAKQGDRSAIRMSNQGAYVQHYTAPEVVKNAKWLQQLAEEERPGKPLTGPLRLWLRFQFAYPKSMPRYKRAGGWWPKETRPDWDNLGKQLCDVLEKTGYFHNDAQLAEVHLLKGWTEVPGVHVRLEQM